MVDAFVSILLDRTETLMVQETSLLRGVEGEVRYLRYELDGMLAFLKEANSRGASDEKVKALVKEVRNIAFTTEDVLDEFALLIAEKDHLGFFGFLLKPASLITEFKLRHQISTKIQEIQKRGHKIKERSETYHLDFNSSDEGTSSGTMGKQCYDPRVASHYIEESEIVGLDRMRNELVRSLLEEDSRRTVIVVAAMGGFGKTTLVKKVYNDQRVEQHFHCHAWITVSKYFRVEELLKKTIKQFPVFGDSNVIDNMDVVQLIDKMRKYLRERRYVVIFDDVWTIDLWESIKHALPINSCGSRIILTTRSSEVASHCVKSSYGIVFDLPPLFDEDAWELFSRKAFGGHCPVELKELSVKIVKKCGGSPLAIVAIGSLLSTKKKTAFEWKKLHDNLGFELERNPFLQSELTGILSLSYNDLPYRLKLCWLYFGIFPEDYDISCSRLIRLWIAEGFVEERRSTTLEDVAEEYLNELIQMCLIQAVKLYSDGRIKSCRVHDVLREIIISKSEEENFYEIVGRQNTSLHENIRRISIQNSAGYVSQNTNLPRLRSIFMFGVDKLPSYMRTHSVNTRLLKVLDLQDAPLHQFPVDLGNHLFHLRYLNLRNTRIKVLPKFSEKLQNLETLNLKGTDVKVLPPGMLHKLKSLRHLLAFNSDDKCGVIVDKGIGCLTSLQNLTVIEAPYRSNHMIRELGKLTQLKKLGIRLKGNEDEMDLSAFIDKMNDLRSLKVFSYNGACLQSVSHPPEILERLYFEGRLEKLPEWIGSLNHLVKLSLIRSYLLDDPIIVLQGLPNLVELNLHRAYIGEQLCFGAQGFQRLKILGLEFLIKLNLVTVEEGALPVLQTLRIDTCQELKKVPSGIKHLRNLQHLDLHYMSNILERALLRWDGEDSENVEHIPFVSFHNAIHGGWGGGRRYGHKEVSYSNMQFLLTEARLLNEDVDSLTPSATQSLEEIPLERTRLAILEGKYPDLTWSPEDIENTMKQRARILSGKRSSDTSRSTH